MHRSYSILFLKHIIRDKKNENNMSKKLLCKIIKKPFKINKIYFILN